jgi:uncharacterized membrane protein YozB (DUF420 family)
MKNYARTGGILTIISAGFGIFLVISMMVAILVFVLFPINGGEPVQIKSAAVSILMLSPFIVFIIVPCVFAIVGGAFGIKKKNWPLALIGAIIGCCTFFICGIPAIIYTTLAKPQFDEAKIQASMEQHGLTE